MSSRVPTKTHVLVGSPGLVAHVLKVVGSNPSTEYRMYIFHIFGVKL